MSISVSAPQFEHLPEALGIGVRAPRVSWRTTAPAGWCPTAYEIEVTRSDGSRTRSRKDSAESVLVPWPAAPLASRESASVRVRVWGDNGSPSEWSAPGRVEAGLLDPSDWSAAAVGAPWDEEAEELRRPTRVRRGFEAPEQIVAARLYVTAHGLYEVEINGRRVGTDALSPGWTVYRERLRYYTYDVTPHLHAGANVIGAWLGDGWYRGRLGFHGGYANLYGTDLTLIAQLEMTTADGVRHVVATDGSWRVQPSPILSSGLYEGEHYDARLDDPAWSSPAGSDTGWEPVQVTPIDPAVLVAPQGPPVRCTEEINPVEILTTPSGKTVLDFGQNFAGRLRLRLDAPEGTTVTLRHAEITQNGELETRPLRRATSTDVYVHGGGRAEWEPRFTMHGFRYAQIDGWPGSVEPGDVVARVYHTDMRRTGWFETSDPLLNRLHENVLWSMRSNFVDIPTDCPQRDERLGWTGDIQVFAPAATFLYDCSGMLTSWLRDVAVEQLDDGTVPWYVPVIPGGSQWTPIRPGAAWGDVAVLTPWTLYQRFGDVEVLRAQYDSAKAWVDLVARLAGPSRLWNSGYQLGDWLDPAAPPDDPAAGRTDPYLVATAYFAWSALHLAKIAGVLGRKEDATAYAALAEQIAQAFRAEYRTTDGRLTSDAQTAYALAIEFGLYGDVEERDRWGRRLAELVHEAGNRITTGFVGTPVVTDALTHAGQVDAAFDLLLETQCPSWLYTVRSGATTIWERWDSLMPDGKVNPGGMTSFNHYAFGAVADWMHRSLAGIEPTAPAYRSILFRPHPGGGLTFARAVHETPYGTASIEWRLDGGTMETVAVVPTGSDAVLELPDGSRRPLTSGTHCVRIPYSRDH